jgi:hypothetical protein
MAETRARTGPVEGAFLGGLLILTCAIVWAASMDWAVAIMPGLIVVLAGLVGYAIYRWQWRPGDPEERPILWSGPADKTIASFRVVGVDGPCPQGFGMGDQIKLGRSGAVSPVICEHAAAALRMAASDPDADVQEWSCPIQDHRLILKREVAGD